jgi:hypothetical protein
MWHPDQEIWWQWISAHFDGRYFRHVIYQSSKSHWATGRFSVQWVLFISFSISLGNWWEHLDQLNKIWAKKSRNKFECLFTRIPYSHQTLELSMLATCIQPGEAGQIPNAYRGSQALLETKWIYAGEKEREKMASQRIERRTKENPLHK